MGNKKKTLIPGTGPCPALIMVIGEAPGTTEEKTGQPFMGRSGKTLDKWLERAGINREKVYITNVIKEKLPGNRAPTQEEVKKYVSLLNVEINKVKPRLIILLGKTPVSVFMPEAEKLQDVVGQLIVKPILGIHQPIFALYHPSFINRMGRDKEEDVLNSLDYLKILIRDWDVK